MKFSGRTFWWSSALGTILIISLLVGIDELSSHGELVEAETRASAQLAKSLGNGLHPEQVHFLQSAQGLAKPELEAHPEQAALKERLQLLTQGLPYLKVQILGLVDGKVLFSSDLAQVGTLSNSTGFRQAANGDSSLELVRHGSFDGPDGPVRNRDIATSFTLVELASGANKPGVARVASPARYVVELHSDVSGHMARYRTGRLTFVIGVMSTLTLSFIMMYLFSSRQAKSLADDERSRRAHESRIHHLAYHDSLTGLPNRACFVERLQESATPRPGDACGVLFIDLDRFKIVNDTLGHKAGDQVLLVLSRRMRAVLQHSDQFYRIGGDEFVVLHRGTDLQDLQKLAQDLVTVIVPPVEIEGSMCTLTVSVGIAQWPLNSEALEQAVRCADTAMYAAKHAGANQTAVYRLQMSLELEAQARLMSGLQQAVDRNEFVLHYQPRVNAVTLEIESVEALVRWRHPEKGLLYPDKFIRELEDSPLIVDAGRWIMEEACRQAVTWRDMGIKNLCVSVNVAARQFRNAGFLRMVRDVLESTGLPPSELELELTESQLIGDLDNAVALLKELQKIGVSVAIDDFGTGYSSLSYLHRLPINCLKIDRSFVQLVSDENNRGDIARSIAMLAHNLGLFVVAEGVETEAQAEVLASWGCEQLQGYLFSKPVSAEAVTELVLKDRSRWLEENWSDDLADAESDLERRIAPHPDLRVLSD